MDRLAVVALVALALGTASCGGPDSGAGDSRAVDDAEDTHLAATACEKPVVPLDAARPVSLLAKDWMAYVAGQMPCVADASLRGILESPDTVWYRRDGIVPGYQDSFGDGFQLPVGMRPNTISPNMINLAVPGGHAQVFSDRGTFHFPFGRPIGAKDAQVGVVDFWRAPRDAAGKLMPVVWWKYQPSGYTRRIDWAFPKDTVFGEMLYVVSSDGHWYPFEIRTRTRTLSGWSADVFRPFPAAEDLATALEAAQQADSLFVGDVQIEAAIAHLRDSGTLQAATLSAPRFPAAFPTKTGARDVLPALPEALVKKLLLQEGFRSAKGAVWKDSGTAKAYAPTVSQGVSIVPPGFNGGMFEVSDATCSTCHRDAGRPFKDFYSNIIAYGELWGTDEVFTWHPFTTSKFVDGTGNVVNFNNDNRTMRKDFVDAGLVAPFDPKKHSGDVYTTIPRAWKKYVY